MQESSERIVEEDSGSDMNTPEEPIIGIIQQSDENGTQILPRQQTWLSYICECFRVNNLRIFDKTRSPLLQPKAANFNNLKTLVLDLDETLVHSSFTQIPCDINLTINIDRSHYRVYVLKRPGLDLFLSACTALFEVIIFTASLKEYANPLIDIIDKERKVAHRLFRDSCTLVSGGYTKDLSFIGRDLNSVIIVDNSPLSYCLQPGNAVPIKTWIDDPNDRELFKMIGILEKLSVANNIPMGIDEIRKRDWMLNEGEEVIISRAEYNSPVNNSGVKKFKFEE